jgi:hypothetical protein
MSICRIAVLAAALFANAASAQVAPFPPGMSARMVETNGTTLHVRTGGAGPAVVLLHGYGETGDMWGALAADLAPTHTVIVPDLRGMGLSAKPDGGYDKANQGRDIAGVLDVLKIGRAGCTVSRPGFPLRANRRAASGRGSMGGNPQKPAALAFPLRRA